MESLELLNIDIQEYKNCLLASVTEKLFVLTENKIIHENNFFDLQLSNVVSFQFNPELDLTVIAQRQGEIYNYNHKNSTLDVVGLIEQGILCMEWSPDYELVVIVTAEASIIIMTKEFDVVSEFVLNDAKENLGFVNVGWGSKNTQFHGTEGKLAALKIETVELAPTDDLLPRISWCGDGNFFVVSAVTAEKDKRALHVYNRNGELQSVSENVSNLEHVVAWRPCGNLIASTQILPHKHDVIFFERNGLRHGEFSLRNDAIVHDIKWSSDSSLLAVCMSVNNSKLIQIWGSSNYYWYLKHEIRQVDQKFGEIKQVIWDAENPMILFILTENSVMKYLFGKKVLKSSSMSSKHDSVVAVIDGSTLHLTPFRFRNVPPPMSFSNFSHSAPVIDAVFSVNNESHDMAVLLSSNRVDFISNANAATSKIALIGSLRF
jgi:elongator complex protein 1